MAPIERISSINLTSYDFMTVVRDVCKKRGLIREDDGGDILTDKQLTNYTIGVNDEEAVVIACIGNEEIKEEDSIAVQRQNIGTEERPHILIGPQEIIDQVNLKLEQRREATKFQEASSSS